MSKWTTKEVEFGKAPRPSEMKKNVIYYMYSIGDKWDGYVKFLCPICYEHVMYLRFEHGRPKEKWWDQVENTWQFDLTPEGFIMNPSVQINSYCKGHFWFKQQEPRIY